MLASRRPEDLNVRKGSEAVIGLVPGCGPSPIYEYGPRPTLSKPCRTTPLTGSVQDPTLPADQTAGRSRSPSGGRGKSGLHGDKAAGNARRGRPQGKRHRKQTARGFGQG